VGRNPKLLQIFVGRQSADSFVLRNSPLSYRYRRRLSAPIRVRKSEAQSEARRFL